MRFFAFLLSAALLATQVGASEKVCSKFKNTVWNGKKVGTGYQGAITVKFKSNCSKGFFGNEFYINYDWVGTGGRVVTPGSLKFLENGKMEYTNNAGSRGSMSRKGNKLTWKNIYTGNSYTVTVTK